MTLQIFNTLTRCKQAFNPIVAGKASLYVCGPTVYDDPHLGHARSAVIFDVLRRYLQATGHDVTLVRNITDIDDKILHKARQHGQDFRSLAAYYLNRYEAAMQRLNILPPDKSPKAGDFILPIQDFIAKLVQGGHAYQAGGNVFFAVKSFKPYGRLSGRGSSIALCSEDTPAVPDKKDPADFTLWKQAKPQEPAWSSPWGPGRPGWHIECSAMSAHLLGEQFDIHGGGVDLIFPHHENEIAQSQSLFGKVPANCWIHNGLVNIANRKMSKSSGNSMNLMDLLESYPPDVLRLFLLSKRYRHPLAFSFQALNAAVRSLGRIKRFFSRIPKAVATNRTVIHQSPLWLRFCRAMDDDFNFPMALSVVFEAVRGMNRKQADNPRNPFATETESSMPVLAELAYICQEIMGFDLCEMEKEFISPPPALALEQSYP
jgi:cysteinyl-tRNA synthetase